MARSVIILGLDGATFDIVDPLVSAGKLNNIAKLLRGGVRSPLISTIHPLTPAAWSSMVTGKNPGKYGVYDFYRRKPGAYKLELVNARVRVSEVLWGILSRHGKRVGVLNVPITYPPDAVNGFVVSGMDAPGLESRFTYPESLRRELVQAVDGYMIDADVPCTGEEEYLELVTTMLNKRLDALHFLLGRYPDLDFLMATLVETDRLQHAFWKYIDPASPDFASPQAGHFRSAFESCFQMIDDLVGEFMAQIGDDGLLLVVSDHGFGPLRKDVYLNKFLADLGLLKFGEGELRLGPESLETIDWEQTKAYAFGYFGNININLMGREPAGIVEPGKEAEQLKSLIASELTKLLDPEDGTPLTDRVWRREELYSGQFLEAAPDILVCMRNYEYMTRGDYEAVHSSLVGPPMVYHRNAIKHSGNHRLDGVLMAYGNRVQKGVRLESAGIADITPTVLHFLGVPVPDDMDGKVLVEAFDPAFIDESAVQFERARSIPFPAKIASPELASTKRLLEEQSYQLRRMSQDLAAATARTKALETDMAAAREELVAMPGVHRYVQHLEHQIAERDRIIARFQHDFSARALPRTVATALLRRAFALASPGRTKVPETESDGDAPGMANPEPVDVSVIIPTRNAGDRFQECLAQIFGQKTRFSYEVLVIDSGSTDQTIRIASSFPTRVVRIPTRDFNHGRTRNLGANLAKGRFLVFTVQDAVPGHESWLDSLVAPLEADNSVAGSYSRQVPLPWANLFVKDLYEWSGTTSHERRVKSVGGNGAWESMSPRAQLDLARFDNVSSCVRKAVLLEIPFPVVDFAEDLHWGKSVLQRGYKLVYEPASFVLHSHSRSLVYDYHRAFLSSQAYYRAFGIRDITGVRGFLDNFRGGFTHRLDLIRRSDLKDEQKANARAQAFLLTFAETLGRWQGAR